MFSEIYRGEIIMKRAAMLMAILLAVGLLASCAPGSNPAAGAGEDVAGFWKGLWHGLITFFTFIISLFNDNVSIYEVKNNGGWYNFGFLIGIMAFWGGGSGGACSGKKRR